MGFILKFRQYTCKRKSLRKKHGEGMTKREEVKTNTFVSLSAKTYGYPEKSRLGRQEARETVRRSRNRGKET